MNITLTRYAQKRARAFQSDHQRQLAKDRAGDWIATAWAAFIAFLIVGSLFV